ncbi:hypothetical protein K438DRAFT_1779481 [Mycena galopus ATCC 62051]|nr:hypothetical protein K438DRAFT_1779481 [Mycena galopus ATCC 62051]
MTVIQNPNFGSSVEAKVGAQVSAQILTLKHPIQKRSLNEAVVVSRHSMEASGSLMEHVLLKNDIFVYAFCTECPQPWALLNNQLSSSTAIKNIHSARSLPRQCHANARQCRVNTAGVRVSAASTPRQSHCGSPMGCCKVENSYAQLPNFTTVTATNGLVALPKTVLLVTVGDCVVSIHARTVPCLEVYTVIGLGGGAREAQDLVTSKDSSAALRSRSHLIGAPNNELGSRFLTQQNPDGK